MDFRYGGKWTILHDDSEFEGQLLINKTNGIIQLEMYHFDDTGKNIFANKLIPKEIPCINGVLINGAKIALMDCSVYSRSSKIFSNTISLVASYALNGINIGEKSEAVFKKVKYRLSHITNWANLNYFESNDVEKYKYNLGYHEKESVTLLDAGDMKIVLEPTYDVEYGTDDEKITLSKIVFINIEYQIATSFEQTIKDVRKVVNLVSLGVATQVDILKVEGVNDDLYGIDIEGARFGKPFEVLTNFTYEERYQKIHPYYCLFMLENMESENNYLLNNWFNNYEKLEPIIELLLDLYKYNMTHERAFLNITQALETYHNRFKANSKTAYHKRIKRILDSCPDEIKEQHLYYLFSDDQRRSKHVILKSRLSDLFLADFRYMFRLGGFKEQYEFVIKTVDTRNYYTHYNESKKNRIFSDDQLEQATYTLKIVLEYHLLKEIGFSDSYIKEKMNQRHQFFQNKFGPH